MKQPHLTLAMLASAAALAACGQKADTEAAQAPPATAAESAAQPADTAMNRTAGSRDAAKTAKGQGAVTAVDAAAGTITIDHGPIPEANWPAMTMAFKAAPEQVASVKPGDQVTFELKLAGGGEITAIRKP
jgi:Cu/Ag efflux protein CusF